MHSPSVVITGTGCLSSAGIGSSAAWESVRDARIGRSDRVYLMGDGRERRYPVYAAPELDLRDWVLPADYSWLSGEGLHEDRDFVMAVAAAAMAMNNAGLSEADRQDAALVLGHENLGVNRLIDRILTSPSYAGSGSPFLSTDPEGAFAEYRDSFYRLQSFPYLFYMAKALRIRGMTLVMNNACATGLYALEAGSQLIRSGRAARVVVTCSDYAHLTEHLWLEGKSFGSACGSLKPYDISRDGSVLGDGAAAVVLEAGSQAGLNPDRIMASYACAAFRQDTWHLTLPDAVSHTYAETIRLAAEDGSGKPIDLIAPHGTGNALWDKYEAAQLRRAFGTVPPVTAFKGCIGHTLGANALLETILLLHCMRDSVIPAAAGCDEPDPKLELPVVTKARSCRLNRVMKAVPAYGGFMAAAVFEQVDR
ncbi:beta-ketoacyl synthase [Paenibacillus sambharensis]|uniref:Beta-ketoacyl synthase n=1 Tax=Paenibacillus sambharensis TaxID=1803190 RepID=A0A2W1L981_9BACL|nr:beta-ketoacyl synthase N-terminal-like domain-containing protein [Paenibacillus sambharensis]PZD95319.1 beta-ketoacyl synthase [Paenibacillus sambharensis]